MAERYGVDTNVLLRLSNRNHPQYKIIATALRRLIAQDVELCFTPQNMGEFWNTITRPVEQNGSGLSAPQTERHLRAIERTLTLLADNNAVYHLWRHLLVTYDVHGVQVHDAHLAAALQTHGATHLLTFNATDFKRFENIIAVSPEDIQR